MSPFAELHDGPEGEIPRGRPFLAELAGLAGLAELGRVRECVPHP